MMKSVEEEKKKNVKKKKPENKEKKKKKLKMKHKTMIKKVDDKDIKNKYQNSFILGWILSNVNVEINESSSQLLQFSYGVFLGSIITLFCVLNITAYIISNHLLDKVEYETKYPKIAKYINRFKKVTLFYISIDILICLFLLSLLVFYSLVIISQLQSSV